MSAPACDGADERPAAPDLSELGERLRAIFDTVIDGIITIDERGQVDALNPAAELMFGYSSGELSGRNIKMLMPEPYHSEHDGYLLNYLLTGQRKVIGIGRQVVGLRKDGSTFPLELAVSESLVGGRRLFTGIVRDVTERWRAEERFRVAVEASPSGQVMVNAEGVIILVNSALLRMFGYGREELLGQPVELLVPVRFRGQHPDQRASFFRTPRVRPMGAGRDLFGLHKDGTEFPVEIGLNPIETNEGLLVLSAVVDITLRKQAEAALRDADRRKDEFLAVLAHELRNPLAPIRAGLEVMKVAQHDPVTLEAIRSTLERQTLQLVSLVDDLLDVSRISRGKLELRKCRFELGEVIQSALEASRPALDEAGHELSVTVPDERVFLEADPNRLAQVLSNLLNNAVKYTRQGGRIWLTAERRGSELVVSVRDTGVGIPTGMQESIFEMFTQIDRSIEKGFTGLGIGLAWAKSLVELHGGTIEVHSDGPDQGSEFIVRLPVLGGTAALDSPAVEPDEPSRSLRVLVVDDNQAAANMVTLVVKMLGNQVRIAGDGHEALDVAAQFRPHVVLLDIGLPRMDGYGVARHLRAQPWGRAMTLIALTGWGQEEDLQQARDAGFDHHLVKPAEPAELQRLIALAAQRHDPEYEHPDRGDGDPTALVK